MRWTFEISDIEFIVSSASERIVLYSRKHDPVLHLDSAGRPFEAEDFGWLRGKQALINFEKANAKEKILETMKTLGRPQELPKHTIGMFWLSERIQLSWYLHEGEIASIRRLVEKRIVSSSAARLTVSCNLYPIADCKAVEADDANLSQFVSGSVPAILDSLSSYSISLVA